MAENTRDIVVIGASSGGVDALRRLMRDLPEDFTGAICVVVHIAPDVTSLLAGILANAGPLRSVHAEDGMRLEHGRIHIAPPDHHLLIERGGTLTVVKGPRENRHRPAIDPLFRSAAWAYGPRVVGVVLTGNLDYGTAGLWAIKSCGGTTIVQDPEDAAYPDMPNSALTHNRIDHLLPLGQISGKLVELTRTPVGRALAPPETLEREVAFDKFEADASDLAQLGSLSPFTCPSCRGALWQMEEGGHLRYRCHVGHSYPQAALDVEHDEAIESSLYVALRAVEEKSMALQRLEERFPGGLATVRKAYQSRIGELEATADQLRKLLEGGATVDKRQAG